MMLDRLAIPVIELAADAYALRANEAFSRFTGIPPERVTSRGWFACLSPDRRVELFAALAMQADFELDVRLLRVDGVKAWVRMVARWSAEQRSYLCALQDFTTATQAIHEAQAEVQRFRLLADNVPVLIAYYERQGLTCVYANRTYASTFGHSAESIIGLTFAQVIGEEAARLIQPQVDLVIEQRRTATYVRELPGPSGQLRWLEVSLIPHQIGVGPVVGCFVLINDITRHRQAENAARDSEERLSKFMDASVEGIAFHRDGYITDVNAPIAQLVGLSPEQMRGRYVLDFVAPDHLPRVKRGMAEGSEVPYEAAIVGRDGQPVAVEFIVRRMRRAGDELRMVVVRDVRDRLAAQARIQHLARHDELTGTLNRRAFMEALDAAVVQHHEQSLAMALMFIDLDRFKGINDAHGHLAGDALLRVVAARIRQLAPDQAVVGRFGGDELVILCPRPTHLTAVRDLAEQLRLAVSMPVEYEQRMFSVTPTIGVAMFPEHGADPDSLLRHADRALYAGKASGRDAVVFFEPGMGAALDAGVDLESQLAHASDNGEFELQAQPRWHARDGTLIALQCSAVWRHPRLGVLSALDLATLVGEQRHRLQVFATWLLRRSLRLQHRWVTAGQSQVPVVLALGPVHVDGAALAAHLAQALAQETVGRGALWLEIDSSDLRGDPAQAVIWLQRLQAMNVGLILKDLGAHGLPLTELRGLPLTGVTLDHGLMAAAAAESGAAHMTAGLAHLAHGQGWTVCAQQLDSQASLDAAVAAGCDHLQGDCLTSAMPEASTLAWLATSPRLALPAQGR